MMKLLLKLFFPQEDASDRKVALIRARMDKKEQEIQRKFKRTTTYFVGRAVGAIKYDTH